MAEVAVRNGVELHLSSPVTGIQKTASGWALTTPSGVVEARYVVNAAGIRADAVHDMAAPHQFTIQPTRGEYYLLDKSEARGCSMSSSSAPTKTARACWWHLPFTVT